MRKTPPRSQGRGLTTPVRSQHLCDRSYSHAVLRRPPSRRPSRDFPPLPMDMLLVVIPAHLRFVQSCRSCRGSRILPAQPRAYCSSPVHISSSRARRSSSGITDGSTRFSPSEPRSPLVPSPRDRLVYANVFEYVSLVSQCHRSCSEARRIVPNLQSGRTGMQG